MPVDPNTLLTFCRALEETAKVGLHLYSREDLLATQEALEMLKEDVERALVRIGQLTKLN